MGALDSLLETTTDRRSAIDMITEPSLSDRRVDFVSSLDTSIPKGGALSSLIDDDEDDPFFSQIWTETNRGALQAYEAMVFWPAAMGDDKAIEKLAAVHKKIKDAPYSPETDAFMKSKTVSEALSALGKDPFQISTEVTAGSAMSSLIVGGGGALAGGFVGGGPNPATAAIGAAVGMGLGSGVLEYVSTYLGVLEEEGVDTSDAESLRSAMRDPDLTSRARNKGILRGIPVTILDAISVGIAGKFYKMGKGLLGKSLGAVADVSAQAATGAGGSIGSDILAGDKISPAGAISEALGEVVQIAPEQVMSRAGQKIGNVLGISDITEESPTVEEEPLSMGQVRGGIDDLVEPTTPSSRFDFADDSAISELVESPITPGEEAGQDFTSLQLQKAVDNTWSTEEGGGGHTLKGDNLEDFTGSGYLVSVAGKTFDGVKDILSVESLKSLREEYRDVLKENPESTIGTYRFDDGKTASGDINVKFDHTPEGLEAAKELNKILGSIEEGATGNESIGEFVDGKYAGSIPAGGNGRLPKLVSPRIAELVKEVRGKSFEVTNKAAEVMSKVESALDGVGYDERQKKALLATVSPIVELGVREGKPLSDIIAKASTAVDPTGKLLQIEGILSGKIKHPKFKKTELIKVAQWFQDFSRKHPALKKPLDQASDAEIVKAVRDHTIKELEAWDKLPHDNPEFYTGDVLKKANPELANWYRDRYKKEITPGITRLYHLLGSTLSGSATPDFDSSLALGVLQRFLDTGILSAYSDTEFATVFEGSGKNRKQVKVDGKPVFKLDKSGNKIPAQISRTVQPGHYQDINTIISKLGLEKAMEWLGTIHTKQEVAEMFGRDLKKFKSDVRHEYAGDLMYGIFGVQPRAKQGSYTLNRWQMFGTITKDLWVARTMARLTGSDLVSVDKKTGKPSVISEPWSDKTNEGVRYRKLLDDAWYEVAKIRGVDPAIVQQEMWDVEQTIYTQLGAGSDPTLISAGLEKGIERYSKNKQLLQNSKAGVKGTYTPSIRVIELAEGNADLSTVVHETAHYFMDVLKDHAEFGKTIRDRYGDGTDRKKAEKFARHFERYIRTGNAPNPTLKTVFEAMREWMQNIYKTWTGGKASKEVTAIFDKVYANPSTATSKLVEEFNNVETINLTRFAPTEGLTKLTPGDEKAMTGVPGKERERLAGTKGLERLNYYTEGSAPEMSVAAVAKNKYEVRGIPKKRLYNLDADPDNLRGPNLTEMEQKIKDSGYIGYYSEGMGMAAVFEELEPGLYMEKPSPAKGQKSAKSSLPEGQNKAPVAPIAEKPSPEPTPDEKRALAAAKRAERALGDTRRVTKETGQELLEAIWGETMSDAQVKHWQESWDQAAESGLADRAVENINAKIESGSVPDDVDVAAALQKRIQLAIDIKSHATTDLLNELHDLTMAIRAAGRAMGRALSSMKMAANTKTLDLATYLETWRETKGAALIQSEISWLKGKFANLEAQIKELEPLAKKAEKLHAEKLESIAKKIAEREFKKAERAKETVTKEKAIADEIARLEREFAKTESTTNMVVGGVPSLGILARLTIAYAKAEGLNLTQAIERVREKFPLVEDRDVWQALQSVGPEAQKKARARTVTSVASLKAQSKYALQIVELVDKMVDKGVDMSKFEFQMASTKVLRKTVANLKKQLYVMELPNKKLDELVKKVETLKEHLDNHTRALKSAKRESSPDLPDASALKSEVRELQKLIRADDTIKDLEEQLATGQFKLTQKLKVEDSAELAAKKRHIAVLRKEITNRIEAAQPKTKMDWWRDIRETPRAVLAGADMSGLRQNLAPLFIHPIITGRSFAKGVQAFMSSDKFMGLEGAIHSSRYFELGQQAGLSIMEHNQQYNVNLVKRVPWLGRLYKAGDRHMTVLGNTIRQTLFDSFIEDFPDASMDMIKYHAKYINSITGIGNLGTFAPAANALGDAFFSVKLGYSRFEGPFRMLEVAALNRFKNPAYRKMIAKDFVKLVGVGTGIISAAYLMGAGGSLYDIDDPDWGKIRLGDTRLDIWGGYRPAARLVLQMAWQPTKRVGDLTGLRELEYGEKINSLTDLVGTFLSYKMSPNVNLINQAITGETVVGEKYEWDEALYRTITPLWTQDLWDASQEHGWLLGSAMGAGAFVGMGVQTYPDSKKESTEKIRTLLDAQKFEEAENLRLLHNAKWEGEDTKQIGEVKATKTVVLDRMKKLENKGKYEESTALLRKWNRSHPDDPMVE